MAYWSASIAVSDLHSEPVVQRHSSCALIEHSNCDELQIEEVDSLMVALGTTEHHDYWLETVAVAIGEVEEYSEHSSLPSVD